MSGFLSLIAAGHVWGGGAGAYIWWFGEDYLTLLINLYTEPPLWFHALNYSMVGMVFSAFAYGYLYPIKTVRLAEQGPGIDTDD